MYHDGNGVPKDDSKANQYYLEALKQPDKLSDDDLGDIYCKLGLNYMSGIGIEQDKNKSIEMLQESAKLKNNLAMYMLGLVSEVNKEYKMANQYFMQAIIEINNHHNMLTDERTADLYFHIGYNYEYGNGVEQNVEKALDYLLEAARLNHNHAMCILANDLEAVDMFDKANQRYIKAIAEIDNNNNHLSDKQIGMVYTNLAINYILGRGIEKNTAKAYELLKKAQPYGDKDALNILNEYFDENGKYLGYEEDSEETVREYERKAQQGNLEAMDYMGDYYRRHDNDEQAKYWYKRSAARNDNYAMYQLGLMDFGKENSESRQWFSKAMQEIDKGNNMIKKDEDLGNFYSILAMYFHQAATLGDERNKKWTVEYYTKSANLNNAAAMNSLGKLYYEGDCVAQNYNTAVNWFQKAVNKGNVEAIGHLGYCYRCGLGVNYDYQRAYELFNKAIDKGDTYSMIQMGFMYEYGEYVEKSTKEANHWYIKAVDVIDKDENLFFLIDFDTLGILYNNLGYNYYAGEGIEKDDEKAFQLLKKSANVYNNMYGMVNLAQMYLDADHILPDTVDYNLAAYSMANDYLYPNHKTAFELLEKADKKGSATARDNLGYYYRFGKYCKQNYKKAFEYFEKSAKHNNDAYGMFQLGLMYDFGEYKEKYARPSDSLVKNIKA